MRHTWWSILKSANISFPPSVCYEHDTFERVTKSVVIRICWFSIDDGQFFWNAPSGVDKHFIKTVNSIVWCIVSHDECKVVEERPSADNSGLYHYCRTVIFRQICSLSFACER